MRHRRLRSASTLMQKAIGAFVRVAVATMVFGFCLTTILHQSGVPVPSAQELFHDFVGFSKIVHLLS